MNNETPTKTIMGQKVFDKKIPRDNIEGNQVQINGHRVNVVFRKIVNDLVRGQMPVIVINGRTGSGKSVLAAYIMYMLHEKLNVCAGKATSYDSDGADDIPNLCYEVVTYAERVLNTLRQCIILDEAGIQLNSKDYHDDMNRTNEEILETMRIKNHCLIYVSPKHSNLDKAIRDAVTIKIVATDDDEYSFKVFIVEQNPESETADKETHYICQIRPPKPPNKVMAAYRDKEEPFKENNLENRINKMKAEEEKEKENNLKI